MPLKSADDKSKRLQLLEELQRSALLDFQQKKWLREELMRQRKGIQGEKDSAFYLDQYFKNGENHVVVHDLRVKVDGDVAQIDHLVINRGNGIYLIETKNYAGNLVINDHGEFTVEYDDMRFGIPSPIEQSQRHERILQRLLEQLDIHPRTGGAMKFYHVVMLHPRATIARPSSRGFDTSNVIKADQFPSWHTQFVDKVFGIGLALKIAVNLRSLDTITEWGQKLVRQHRPDNLLKLPEFMQPKTSAAENPRSTATAMSPSTMTAPAGRGVSTQSPARQALATANSPVASDSTTEPAKRLICADCGTKITFAEGKFCWNNPNRFGGRQYCREHQVKF